MNSGDILVRLKPRGDRSRAADEIITDLRDKLTEAAPDTEIEFVQLLQDMLGDLEGNPDADRGQGLRRRSRPSWRNLPIRSRRGWRRSHGVVDLVGLQEGGPESTWTVDPRGRGADRA